METGTPKHAPPSSLRVIRLKEVCRQTGLSRASIYRLMGARDFPRSYPLSPGTVGWSELEVQKWIAKRLCLIPSDHKE
ncbi:MAG TPA: AlpA family transcriptional regulator [Thermoanaerobaculia bacterium]|nr:AlpA family transcriptional regulator [Thermoanaerobaculia bacterium]